MEIGFLFTLALIGFAVIFASKTIQIVPQQRVYVVERLGRYHGTLSAGLHFVIPFVDRIAYRHSMKEIVIDIPEQVCITNDNVQVNVDGILFFRIMDAQRASYGVSDYFMAITQLAQTTIRSEIGKIALDRSFEERENVNALVVAAIDKASDPWGVKVLRYEIKSINPPRDVLAAMEKQMRAEREKRAIILESEGDRDAKIKKEQQSRSAQAAGHQELRGEPPKPDQRGPGPGRGHPLGRDGFRRRFAPHRRGALDDGRHGRRAPQAGRSLRAAVRPARQEVEHDDPPGGRERRGRHGRHRDGRDGHDA